MNWKTRQLFSDREHGIVSGLSPVNMAGGGSVPYPSYQEGGIAEEQRADDFVSNLPVISGRANPFRVIEGKPQSGWMRFFDGDVRRAAGRAGGTEAAQEAPEEISIEQRVAALAAQQGISVPAARAMILNQMLEQQGVTLSEEVINQFATGLITLQEALAQVAVTGSGASTLEEKAKRGNIGIGVPYSSIDSNVLLEEAGPPKLQAGTGLGEAMAIDLFQQGDEEINAPLNRMAQVTNPSIADITPTETVGEIVTEDQGPTDTENSKSPFRKLAIQVVVDANKLLIQEDYMNIEEVEQQVKENLTIIDEQYRLQTGADDTILTPEFLDQLDQMMRNAGDEFDTAPGMEDGGTVWDFIGGLQGKGVAPAKIEEIIKKYYNPEEASEALKMLKDRQQRARRGALLGGKTKQGGWAGMMDILGQADAAEAAAIGSMPETLATNEAALKRLAMSGELETSGAISSKMPVDVQKMLITQRLWEDTTMEPGLRTVLLDAVANVKTREAAMQEFKTDLIESLIKQEWNDLKGNWLKTFIDNNPEIKDNPQAVIIKFADEMTKASFNVKAG